MRNLKILNIPVGWLLALLVVSAMFLPRIVTEGMFLDGNIYASVARNLALGRGTVWMPYCTAHDFINEWGQSVFYDQPPFQYWLQSLFFKLLGDHWWVEKLYGALILVATLILLVAIWRQLFGSDPIRRDGAWLAVLLWFLVPTVSWGMPCNMLEGTLGLCCLAAVWAVLRNSVRGSVAAGLLVFCAVLTKGPVGLFPLAAPLLLWWAQRRPFLWWQIVLPTAVFSMTFGLLLCYAPAGHFFQQYWEIQVLQSLNGIRETSGVGWAGHFFLVEAFFAREGLPVLLLAVAVVLLGRWRASQSFPGSRSTLFAWAVFCSATLPMLLSIKQRSYYLMPAAPWLALALAGWMLPYMAFLGRKITPVFFKTARYALLLALLGTALYAVRIAGTPGRDAELLALLHEMQGVVPPRETLALCPGANGDHALHIYLQRYGGWERSDQSDGLHWAVVHRGYCAAAFFETLTAQGWQRVAQQGEWALLKK